MPIVNHKTVRARQLKNPDVAIEYLRLARVEGRAAFKVALKNVIEANGGAVVLKSAVMPLDVFQHLIEHELQPSNV